MKRLISVLIFVLLLPGVGWGDNTTYYVDSVDGNDTWAGTAPDPTPVGSPTNGPWKTVTKVNAAAKAPNDKIYFRCGQTFSDSHLSISTTATAGNETIYGAYGTGNKPIITTCKVLTTWAKTAGKTNVYEKTVGASYCSYGFSNKMGVFEDWADMIGVADTTAVDASPGTFYYDGNVLYIHTFESDDPAGHTIRAMYGDYGCLRSNNASNWIVQDIEFRGGRRYNIISGTSANCTIRRCLITKCETGIYSNNAALTGTFTNNTFVGNYGDAIYLDVSGAALTVSYCIIAGNLGKGLNADAGTTFAYDHCLIYANGIISAATGYIYDLYGAGTFTNNGGNITDKNPRITNPGYNNISHFIFTVDDSPNRPYAESIGAIFSAAGKHFTWFFGPTKATNPDSRWSSPSETQSGSATQWATATALQAAGHDIGTHTRNHQRFAVDSTGTGASTTDAIKIRYVGAGSACAMTISGNALTTTCTGDAPSNLNIDLTNASYDNMSELVAYIDGLAAYTCTIVSTTEPTTDSITLADVAGQDIKTAEYTCVFNTTKLPDQEFGDSATVPTLGGQYDFSTNSLTLPTTSAYPYGFYNATVMGYVNARGFSCCRSGQIIINTNILKWNLAKLSLFEIPVEYRLAADAWKIDSAAKGTIHGERISLVGSVFPMFYTMLEHKTTEMPLDAVTSMVSAIKTLGKVNISSLSEAVTAIKTAGHVSTDGYLVTRKIVPTYDWKPAPGSPCYLGGSTYIGAYEPYPSGGGLSLGIGLSGNNRPPKRQD